MKNFDIVIPVGPNELDIIYAVVAFAKVNVKGYRNIYLISCKDDLRVLDCITISESIFPFNFNSIQERVGESSRINWIYQQLLKLYAVSVIPDCLENILILDADVLILRELSFFEDDKPIFTVGHEYTEEYHKHSEKLHPSINRVIQQYSGVSHHMIFNKSYLLKLFKLVEDYHRKDFLIVFLEALDRSNINDIRCSEYEIYFNFMCRHHTDEMYIRELKWANQKYLTSDSKENYDYVSIPKYEGTR
jgi:hypothetical protein